jgi:tetraacyldisaccharide 4'-kinase
VDAGRQLLARHPEVDVLVSDDGLQHHRLARDVQVLVFDERGAGNGWLLPAGPLREPMPPRLPAHTLVVYNAPAASTALPGFVAARSLRGVVSLADWWQGRVASRDALIGLRGRPMLAVAGLARPGRFFDMLRAQGLTLSTLALPDHHDYAVTPWPATAPDVVVTEKDAVKLRPGRVGATRVWVATLDFSLGAEFDAALMQWLAPPSPRQTGNDHGNTTARPAGVPAVQGPAGAPAPADERAP